MSFAHRKIYLAGPITGWSYNNARHGWRKEFADILKHREATHLECYSPMREKEFLEKDQCIGGEADYQSLHGFGTPQGILTRDYNDVFTCDAMVACFLGATAPSIGTCVEFGFAKSHNKPVIMIMEPSRTEVIEDKQTKVRVPQHTIAAQGFEAAHAAIVKEVGATYTLVGQYDDASDDTRVYGVLSGGMTRIIKNPHDHVFLRACAGYVVPTLEHAADIAQSLLTPGL